MKGKWICIGILIGAFVVSSVWGAMHIFEVGKVDPVDGQVSLPTESAVPQPYGEEKDIRITLYFGDETASHLVPEQRNIKVTNEKDLPKLVMDELIKGPKTTNGIAVVDKDTKLNSVKRADNVAVVDFGDNFEALNTGGSSRERLCLYAIVNSLTELDNIDKVKLSVNGKILDLFGQMELLEPLVKNNDIIGSKN